MIDLQKKHGPVMRRVDTAKELKCSERKVDRLIESGLIKASKIGRSVLINTETVQRLLPQE